MPGGGAGCESIIPKTLFAKKAMKKIKKAAKKTVAKKAAPKVKKVAAKKPATKTIQSC